MNQSTSVTESQETNPPWRTVPRGWRLAVIVILLESSYILNSMDRNIFGVLAPDVRGEFGFSLGQVGLLASSFALGVGFGGLAAAYIVDRFSTKFVMAASVAVFSITTWAQSLAVGFFDFAAYRVISGLGEGVQVAVLFASMAMLFPRRRTLAIGTLSLAFGVGALIGPWLGGGILQATGSWRLPLVTFAVIGLVFVIAIAWVVPRQLVPHVKKPGESLTPERFMNRNIPVLLIAAVVGGFSLFGFVSLFPSYLREHLAFSPTDAGLAGGMFGAGALAAIPAGWLGDKFYQKWIITLAFLGLAITGTLTFSLDLGVASASVLGFCAGAMLSGFLFTNIQSALQRSMPASRTGFASGLFVAFWFFPATVSGYVFGELRGALGWGWSGLIMFGVLPAVAIIALLFIDRSKVRNDAVVAAH